MAVEDLHEDRNPDQSLGAHPQLGRGHRAFDQADDAIRRADQQARVFRHQTLRVAEKVERENGEDQTDELHDRIAALSDYVCKLLEELQELKTKKN